MVLLVAEEEEVAEEVAGGLQQFSPFQDRIVFVEMV